MPLFPVKFNTEIMDLLLDETDCPVARMRLFSEGISVNTRLFTPEGVIGDRGCIACGNCVDACPVVKEEYRFIFVQNQRTSMALENMVGQGCRRCYKCVVTCPQVSKPIKEYASAFRRGEKIVHLLAAAIIISLAMSGITLMHYSNFLPAQEVNILRWGHRILGLLLLLLPILYFVLDKRHLFRFLRKVSQWEKTDWDWMKALIQHIGNTKKYPMPPRIQFNPGQKAWYLYIICIMLPVLSITGIIQWLGLDYGFINASLVSPTMLIHMAIALTTDLLLFVHLYLKYLRNWAILSFDVIRAFTRKRHLVYPLLYDSRTTLRNH